MADPPQSVGRVLLKARLCAGTARPYHREYLVRENRWLQLQGRQHVNRSAAK